MKKSLFLLLSFGFLIGEAFAAGSLQVSARTPQLGTLPRNAISIPFLEITARAVGEDVRVSEIHVRHGGLSRFDAVERLMAITNDYRRSMRRNFSTDGLAVLPFRRPYLIPAGQTRRITVVGNLNLGEAVGQTVSVSLDRIISDASELANSEAAASNYRRTARQRLIRSRSRGKFRMVCKNRRCYRVAPGHTAPQ